RHRLLPRGPRGRALHAPPSDRRGRRADDGAARGPHRVARRHQHGDDALRDLRRAAADRGAVARGGVAGRARRHRRLHACHPGGGRMTRPDISTLSVGDVIGQRVVTFDRADLVRYAGASGDRNPIHWSDRVAREAGLPGVIAHGMLTMGTVVNVVVDWAGDPGAVVDYQTRFSKPVEVPDPGAATVEVTGTIGALDVEAGTVRVDLAVTVDGAKVLGRAQALVRL